MRIANRSSFNVLAMSCLFFGAHHAAHAATATTTFNVTATVAASCSATATDLTFGAYNIASATPLDGTSTISVSCTSGTTYTVALNIGAGGGTFAARRMASGGNLLTYNLYTTTGRTTVWGDGTASTATVAGTGSGLLTPNAATVYGRVPINQDVAAGSYASLITVTINY